jgi:hypothetical protein
MYAGKQDSCMLPGETDCGASANVVIRLSQLVRDNCNFRIFFDYYFNSMDLQLALARRRTLSLGTVHLNRLPYMKQSCQSMEEGPTRRKLWLSMAFRWLLLNGMITVQSVFSRHLLVLNLFPKSDVTTK